MTFTGPLRDREVNMIQYAVQIGLEGSSTVFMEALDDIVIELNDTPWWRPLKRFHLNTEWQLCYRLGLVFQAHHDGFKDFVDTEP